MLKVHSIESFSTQDGPGIRFVIFLQWCMFKCLYCHNPDTIPQVGGKEMTDDNLIEMIEWVKPYFSKNWWITVSGWEPLLQAKWLVSLFEKLKEKWYHIAIDTNWYPWNEYVKQIVELSDLFLLDIKQINNDKHIKLTGKSNVNTLKFLDYLELKNKKTWIRYVLVPWYTDDIVDLKKIWEMYSGYKCIEKIQILPYHNLWEYKRKEFWWKYKLSDVEPPSLEKIEDVKKVFQKYFKSVCVW